MNINKANIPLVVISLSIYIIVLAVFYITKKFRGEALNLSVKKVGVYFASVFLILLMLFYDSNYKYLMILCAFAGSLVVARDSNK